MVNFIWNTTARVLCVITTPPGHGARLLHRHCDRTLPQRARTASAPVLRARSSGRRLHRRGRRQLRYIDLLGLPATPRRRCCRARKRPHCSLVFSNNCCALASVRTVRVRHRAIRAPQHCTPRRRGRGRNAHIGGEIARGEIAQAKAHRAPLLGRWPESTPRALRRGETALRWWANTTARSS
jgi:hypothetical protein